MWEGTSVGVGPDSPSKLGDDQEKEKNIEEQKKDTILHVSNILKQVKLAKKSKEDESKTIDQELKKEWMLNFLKNKGFEFSYQLFFVYKGSENKFSKVFLGFLLNILRIFITAAFMAVEPSVVEVITLNRKLS